MSRSKDKKRDNTATVYLVKSNSSVPYFSCSPFLVLGFEQEVYKEESQSGVLESM